MSILRSIRRAVKLALNTQDARRYRARQMRSQAEADATALIHSVLAQGLATRAERRMDDYLMCRETQPDRCYVVTNHILWLADGRHFSDYCEDWYQALDRWKIDWNDPTLIAAAIARELCPADSEGE